MAREWSKKLSNSRGTCAGMFCGRSEQGGRALKGDVSGMTKERQVFRVERFSRIACGFSVYFCGMKYQTYA